VSGEPCLGFKTPMRAASPLFGAFPSDPGVVPSLSVLAVGAVIPSARHITSAKSTTETCTHRESGTS
jgi:hypothetical protein